MIVTFWGDNILMDFSQYLQYKHLRRLFLAAIVYPSFVLGN